MATGTGLTGSTSAVLSLRNVNTVDLNVVVDSLDINTGISWSYGAGANQMNVLYHDTVTIADGANTTIDLYTGAAMRDQFGNLLTMTAIKLIYIKNKSADATLNVGGGASFDCLFLAATSDILVIPPLGFFLWVCPTAAGIVTTTNENIYLAHDGTGSDTMGVDMVFGGLD